MLLFRGLIDAFNTMVRLFRYGVEPRTALAAAAIHGADFLAAMIWVFQQLGALPRTFGPADAGADDLEQSRTTRAEEAEVLAAMYEESFHAVSDREWLLSTGLQLSGGGFEGGGGGVEDAVVLCPFFLEGRCRFGATCRNSHSADLAREHRLQQLVQERQQAGHDGHTDHPLYSKLRQAEQAKTASSKSVLEIRFPEGSRYPLEPPVVLFRNSMLSPAAQFRVSRGVMRQAAELALDGVPSIYSLVIWLEDGNLEELVSNTPGPATGTHATDQTEGSVPQPPPKPEPEPEPAESSTTATSAHPTPPTPPLPPSAARATTEALPARQLANGPAQKDVRRGESHRMLGRLTRIRTDPDYITLLGTRRALPVFGHVKAILAAIASHQAVVICGAPGCGKTTQVPQFILDAWTLERRGGDCNIVCTQPCCIAAIGAAERVSAERVDGVGNQVGHRTRFEARVSARTRLLFCTTEILLRKLELNPTLDGVTHVVVDEVHERSIDSDILLMMLRDVVALRPALTVVMLSATANAELFSDYFGGLAACPVLAIPGQAFPVETLFLEDAVECTGYQVDAGSEYVRRGSSTTDHPSATPDERQGRAELASFYRGYAPGTVEALSQMDLQRLNLDLVSELLVWMCSPPQQLENPGAVLVFLPGYEAIAQLVQRLANAPAFAARRRFQIVPLHSLLPLDEQLRVFVRPPHGVTKIVLATGMAKTSVTIDDVAWVLDGVQIEAAHPGPCSVVWCRASGGGWVSQASALHRRGRAGRARPGRCVHLVTRRHFLSLSPRQLPEIRRIPLEQLCLRVLALPIPATKLHADLHGPTTATATPGKKTLVGLARVLARLIEPPPTTAVLSAMGSLRGLHAVDEHDKLTALGHHLAMLPVGCRVGKLLLFGAIFRCLDGACAVAACLSLPSMFVAPFGQREEADAVRKTWGCHSSDHLTMLRVYDAWVAAGTEARTMARQEFARANFVSHATLQQVLHLKRQFVALLSDLGFAPPGLTVVSLGTTAMQSETLTGEGSDGVRMAAGAEMNANACPSVLKAVLCAALYPNVLKVTTAAGKTRVEANGGGTVAFHPASAVDVAGAANQVAHCVYRTTPPGETGGPDLRECSSIGRYPLLLFAGRVTSQGSQLVLDDGFVTIRDEHSDLARLVLTCRAALERLLRDKIANPALDIAADPVVLTLVDVFKSE